MKKNTKNRKEQAEGNKISFFITEEEYGQLEEYAKKSKMKLNDFLFIGIRAMLDDIHDIAKQQEAEFGVPFANPENCEYPDCVSRNIMHKAH